MYNLIWYLPIILLSLILIFSRLLGIFFISLFIILVIFFLWIISILIFYEVCILGFICNIKIFTWLQIHTLNINIEFFFDFLSSSMLLMVITISLLVFIYSIEYMYKDPHFIRFMFYLVLFMFCMIILVCSKNLFQLFLGWEGVGILSYLLINFWFTKIEANRSAIKALLLNKIGDCGLYIAIILIFSIFKTLDFTTIFSITPLIFNLNPYFYITEEIWVYSLDLICFFLFIAVIGKSAQLGLHIWLPDAMEGPTPVSALLHAATMVTAGVFLLIRFAILFEYSNIMLFICFFGALTALISSFIGMNQYDIKKIIAYSTCSQLGYMVFSCGMSSYNFTLFHMFNHAFFKALLFLAAGALIIIFNGEQDIRLLTLNPILNPYLFLVFFIATFSLTGMYFFSGFYSKELILENSYISFIITGSFIYWLGLIVISCTSFYSFKILYFVFLNTFFQQNNFKIINSSNLKYINESKFLINIVLYILSIFSVFSGYFFYNFFLNYSNTSLNSILINNKINLFYIDEILPWYLKLLPFTFTCIGILACWIIFNYFYIFEFIYILNFLKKKCYFDLFAYYCVEVYLFITYDIIYKLIDKGLFEFIGPRGLLIFLKNSYYLFKKDQLGFIIMYIEKLFFYIISFCILSFIFIIFPYQILLINFYIFLFLYFFKSKIKI